MGHPLYTMLLPIPIVCFLGALLTDLAYWNSDGNWTWLNFSTWLIPAGLVFGGLALAILLVDLLRSPRRGGGAGWWHFLLLGLAWLVEFFNAFIHQRDGWTAVVPTGLMLSLIGSLLALASGWIWQSFRYDGAGEAA